MRSQIIAFFFFPGERWDTKKICNICGKVLSRGDKLKNHIRTHTNNFPYHCDSCGQGFLRSEGLRVHTRIHTGERPYVCILCGKAYTRKDKLTRHAIVHTGERPFVCQHCGKSFTRKDKMQRHELIHRVDKPFTCSPCNLEFVRQETLNTHLEKKHPERLPYTLHPAGGYHQELNGMVDSKNGITKESQSSGKASSKNTPPASSSGSSSPNNTQATSTITTPTVPVVSHSAPLLSGNPLYGGMALPSTTAALGAPLLSGPPLLTSSSVLNGFTGGLAFSNAPSMPGGSLSHVHAATQS